MMNKHFYLNEALTVVFDYWARYSTLNESHFSWLKVHAEALPPFKRKSHLFLPGLEPDFLYFVIEGLLAGVSWDAEGDRRIYCLARQEFGLFTCANLYTPKQVDYELIALRETRVLRIPAAALLAYKEASREADVLVDVLLARVNKQLKLHNKLLLTSNERERVKLFYEQCPKLASLMTLEEQADYLNVSLSTLQRVRNPKKEGNKKKK